MKIKKGLAALLAAVTVLGMVSCGSAESTSSADEDTSSEAVSTADESEEETESVDAAEETEDSTDDSEEDTDGTYENGVFTNAYYTVSVDESKWEDATQSGVDCAFSYTADDEKATANINIVSMNNEAFADLSPKDYAESIEEAYSSMDGYEVTASEEGTLGDYESYNLTITYEISDQNMTINQIILSNNSTLVAISYGALDSVLSDMQSEFDEILDTFKFN